LFVATVFVFLVVGGLLGGTWAYYLARPCVLPQSGAQVITTIVTGTPTTEVTAATSIATTSAPAGAEVPNVTVDMSGMASKNVIHDIATLVVFLMVNNPSGSSITVTEIKYEVWINDIYIGSGGTNQSVSIPSKSELEIRTELASVPLSTLPVIVANIVGGETVNEASAGGSATLHIKGALQIKDGFGTADVPFEGRGEVGQPVAT
jgi:LEA14-like dessication related protein